LAFSLALFIINSGNLKKIDLELGFEFGKVKAVNNNLPAFVLVNRINLFSLPE